MAARRAPGEGALYFDEDRKVWVGSISAGYDPVTRRRIRRKVSDPVKTVARDKLRRLAAEQAKAGQIPSAQLTVEKIINDFLANPPEDWTSPITLEVNKTIASRIIKAIGKTKARQLTAAQVERMLRDMVASGCSASVKVRTRSLLFRALKRAQRDHGLTQNAAALADMPAGGTRRASRAMTLDEISRLLASKMTVWWRAWITTAIMTGLRPGELLGLTWANVDFAESTLSVRQAMKEDGPGSLKTKTSHRTLEMPAAVAAALTDLLAEQVTRQLAAGESYDSGPVFADEAGRPVRREMVRHGLARRCKAAGIATFSPREMRHTWVSVLSDAGVDIEVIASGAGHVNSNVTRSVYRHQIADKISAAATVFNSLAPTAGSPEAGAAP